MKCAISQLPEMCTGICSVPGVQCLSVRQRGGVIQSNSLWQERFPVKVLVTAMLNVVLLMVNQL